MLTLLTQANFRNVEDLYRLPGHHLALRALLDGAVPGEVYADDPRRPSAALAWVQQRLFLAGAPGGAWLKTTLTDAIGPAAIERGLRYLVLHYEPAAWAKPIAAQVEAFGPHFATRHYYEFRAACHPWQLPEGYTLRGVDRALLNDAGLGQRDQLRAEMCSERPSVEAFLEHSFGVCAVHGGDLAGWCLSEYNHAGACEVGIETLPEHRGRRLATIMTTALVEQANAQGIQRIGWHCQAQNAASVATALAAGFERVAEYPAVVLDFEASLRGA